MKSLPLFQRLARGVSCASRNSFDQLQYRLSAIPSRRHSSGMLSSPRRPDTTIRIFSSAEYYLRVLRRISRTVRSAVSLEFIDSCLIFVPFGHDDEPAILRYEITSICPISADVRHGRIGR